MQTRRFVHFPIDCRRITLYLIPNAVRPDLARRLLESYRPKPSTVAVY